MDKNIIIRPVRPEDAEEYFKVNNAAWRDAYKHIFPEEVFVQKESNTPNMIKTFAQFVYHGKDQICYVAEVNGKMIGFVTGRLTANNAHFAKDNFAELMAIYILPEYQSQGLGSKFKNLFVDWAKKNGATKFVIGVLKDNHKARKAYEKWGGKLDSHTQPFIKLGTSYTEVFYVFDLTEM